MLILPHDVNDDYEQETDETYDNIKETSQLVEAIETCPVMLEEDFQFQHQDMYQQVGSRVHVICLVLDF